MDCFVQVQDGWYWKFCEWIELVRRRMDGRLDGWIPVFEKSRYLDELMINDRWKEVKLESFRPEQV